MARPPQWTIAPLARRIHPQTRHRPTLPQSPTPRLRPRRRPPNRLRPRRAPPTRALILPSRLPRRHPTAPTATRDLTTKGRIRLRMTRAMVNSQPSTLPSRLLTCLNTSSHPLPAMTISGPRATGTMLPRVITGAPTSVSTAESTTASATWASATRGGTGTQATSTTTAPSTTSTSPLSITFTTAQSLSIIMCA